MGAVLILLIRLLLIAVVLYAVLYVYRIIKSAMQTFNSPFRPTEACPACQRPIQVSGTEAVCPHCGVKLGRTPDGKLIIRVN